MNKDMHKDMHKTGWMQPPAPFGGPKLDYQQQKPVKPEKQTIEQDLGIGAFGRIEKKESE
jgi:hypothetical protein|tara:strand:- start:62 stop:241 length:180 start_codon:yes stop_codon:yes gene_type:complete